MRRRLDLDDDGILWVVTDPGEGHDLVRYPLGPPSEALYYYCPEDLWADLGRHLEDNIDDAKFAADCRAAALAYPLENPVRR